MERRHRRPPTSSVELSAFAGFRFPPEVIVWAVRWYLRFGLSYRDLEELLAERGIDDSGEVGHVRDACSCLLNGYAPLASTRRSGRRLVVGTGVVRGDRDVDDHRSGVLYGPIAGSAVAWASASIGATVPFAISRRFGPRRGESPLGPRSAIGDSRRRDRSRPKQCAGGCRLRVVVPQRRWPRRRVSLHPPHSPTRQELWPEVGTRGAVGLRPRSPVPRR